MGNAQIVEFSLSPICRASKELRLIRLIRARQDSRQSLVASIPETKHHIHSCLFRNPGALYRPLLFRVCQLPIKIPTDLQYEFVYLEQSNVLADTSPRTSTKLVYKTVISRVTGHTHRYVCAIGAHRKQVSSHFFELFWRGLNPSLRSKCVNVSPKNRSIAVEHPCIDSDYCSFGDVNTRYDVTASRDIAFENETYRRMNAKGLINDC